MVSAILPPQYGVSMMLLIQFWDKFCKCGGDILQKSSLNVDNPFEESRIECEQSDEGETKV